MRLQWAGHVERMADDILPNRAAELREQDRRRRGRPRLRWDDHVKRNLRKAGEESRPIMLCQPAGKYWFSGRSAVAVKLEKKTQRRIDSFRFMLPPPLTVTEETSDGLTATTE